MRYELPRQPNERSEAEELHHGSVPFALLCFLSCVYASRIINAVLVPCRHDGKAALRLDRLEFRGFVAVLWGGLLGWRGG